MIDFDLIISNLQKKKPPKRVSTKKKFKYKNQHSESEPYEISYNNGNFTRRKSSTGLMNHLKPQGKKKTNLVHVRKHFLTKTHHSIKKSKGLFGCGISVTDNWKMKYFISIYRRKINLISSSGKYDLTQKDQRFEALLKFDFDYEKLLQIQNILKQKQSGNYLITTI